MLNRTKIDIERGMGWLTLAGGGLILLFWTVYFAGAMELGQHDPVISGFESAFPIADALFCALLIAAGITLLKRRPAGPYFLVAGGAGFAASSRSLDLEEQVTLGARVAKEIQTWGERRLDRFRAMVAAEARRLTTLGRGDVALPYLDRWDREGGGWS